MRLNVASMAQPSQEAPELKRGDSRLGEELTDPRVLRMAGAWSQFLDSTDKNPSSVWRVLNAECGASAIPYYDEMEEKVDEYGAALEQRTEGVLSKDMRVAPASDSARDQMVAEFCQEALDNVVGWDQKLSEALDALSKGVSIAELMYGFDGRRIVLEDIRFRNQAWFCFGETGEPEIGPLRLGYGFGAAAQREPLPVNKFWVSTFGSRRGNRWGRPLGRRCFWPSWFLRTGIRLWLKWLEKGNGTLVAKYPQGVSTEVQALALEAAEAAQDTTAVAIPDTFILEMLAAARAGGTLDYDRNVRRAEGAIAKRVLGQTLTSAGSDQGSGSLALGEVHNDVRQDKVQADAAWLELCVTQGILKPLTELNFGVGTPVPQYVIEAEEGEDLGEALKLLDGGRKLGMRISRAYAHERLHIPEAEEGDEEVLGAGGQGLREEPEPEEEEGDPAAFAEAGERADPEPERVAAQGVRAGARIHKSWVDQMLAEAMEELPE